MHYNLCRVHQTLRVTPAMEAVFLTAFGAWKKSAPWLLNQGMNYEASHKAFAHQLQRFRELFYREMKSPLGPTIASPKSVLNFAEDLMLCPTEEEATVRIQRDREAARGCYIIANDVGSAADRGHAQLLIEVGKNETPFCLLGSVVRLRAQNAIEKHGDSWL